MPSISPNARSIALAFRIDPDSQLSLQAQLRTRIIETINAGLITPGQKLPSSRQLAVALSVSRNTVTLAYQQLAAEGHLVTRERSGFYVAASNVPIARPAGPASLSVGRTDGGPSLAAARIRTSIGADPAFRCPPDWQNYRFPFIEGRYDQSLFPVAEWREASRFALGVREIEQWSIDNGDADDEKLVEEIRTKLLPRRGISARPDEILITSGEQQAFHLLAELFLRPGIRVGVEEPGLPAMRELAALRGAATHAIDVDEEGLVIGEDIGRCDIVHVSPSRQRPTGVTMSRERRQRLLEAARSHDLLVIEDDFECEMTYLRSAQPAMRAMDGGERVLYVAALSKLLSPGIRLGYLVGPADVIAAARRLRSLTTKRPSPNNQRTAAFFLSLGHYDAMLSRLNRVCEARLIALRDALNHYRPESIAIPPVEGGTAYWVKGPENLDAGELVRAADAHGILIEPVDAYFADPARHQNMFRLGITSIPQDRIRTGVELLSTVMRDLSSRGAASPPTRLAALAADEIEAVVAGASLRYKTVYGEPCTIEIHSDGRLAGRAGYANEDRDEGIWWIDGEKWFRRWDHWAYGEEAGFRIHVDGDTLSWLSEDGRVVDAAKLIHLEGAG